MAAASTWPTLGSSASCICFSSMILRSHKRTCRSASRTSAVMSVFSSLTFSTAPSISRHEFSISFNFATNSVSIIWFALASSFDLPSLLTRAPFIRSMSRRKCFMAFFISLISFCCDSSWPSILIFFCSNTIFLFFWSLRWLRSLSVSVESASSCVCFWIQSFCMSLHSFLRSLMPLFKCFSLASCGPATSASPASASSFSRLSSNSLFRRST
mmetsp:Transcript_127572/g.254888  ORF Transcript_127572/g.254888 Transcript_127572/m.254888 type:complete len:213 (-) Transcript_127572:1423-2061(-)